METYGIKNYGVCPNSRQMEWYRRERTIFFHFGMNTFTDREWGDGTDAVSNFNPTELDCRQWVKTIKDAGFTMAIITAKHHDGFCLWQTKYTDYSVKNSPYKNGKGDVVREFTDACREFGIKAGIYLSPWDRHEPTWGKDEYNDFYANQLTELMTNYGKIWECWWDGAGSSEANYDWDRWAGIIREKQPDAVIFGSLGATPHVDVRWVGNENGIAGNPCYATINAYELEVENTFGLNRGTLDGNRFIPAESDVSIRPGWFYHKEQDNRVRTPKNLINLWFKSIGRNTGLLLNLPPDRRGLIFDTDAKSLLEFNKILKNGFANNLALKAKVTADSVRENCPPEMIFEDDEEKFYAPADTCHTPTLEFSFDEPITFNVFKISEMIEFGQKIRGFCLKALIDGEYRTLFEGACLGYRQADHFDTVTTKKLRLEITDAPDVPAIRDFGLYMFDEALFEKEEIIRSEDDLLASSASKIEVNENETIVDLGGIFPYNSLEFESEGNGRFKLYIFNGTTYDFHSDIEFSFGKNAFSIDMIENSYKFKMVFDTFGCISVYNMSVFCK